MGSEVLRISELIEAGHAQVTTGPFGTQLSASEYVHQGTPVINVRNVGLGDLRTADLEFVDETKAAELHRHQLQANDIVFGRKGAVERHALIRPAADGWIQGSDCITLRLNGSAYRPKFASIAMRTPWHQQRMLNLCSFGATMPSLNQEIVGMIELPAIEVEAQDRIIEAISAFDDLIANNGRRIEVLEEMARLLYQEWFLHFRFPGHEDVELIDSDLGTIPEGWEVSRVGDALETVGGGTPSKEAEEYWADGSVQWFTPTDLTRARSAFAFDSGLKISELGLKKSSAKLFPAGSVMMTSRATIGVVSIAAREATTNQGFVTTVPNERLPSDYIYFWLQSNVDLFLSLAGGATFRELRKSTFRELPILVPGAREMEHFKDSVGPMMALIKDLLRQNGILLKARDLLLPRLVSGELDVTKLDLDLVAV